MSRFTIEPSLKGDSDWAVHEDGKPVAWFSGTNAAERFIAVQEAIEREIDKAAERRPSMSRAERRHLNAFLKGGR